MDFLSWLNSESDQKENYIMDEIRHTFSEWIKSGNENIPPVLERHVHAIAKFHTIKAIDSGILYIIFLILSTILWLTLIKRSKVTDAKWGFTDSAYFVFGIATVFLSLLMMVVVVANIQGAFAPLASFLGSLLNE